MSRYTKETADGKVILVWGYDRPMSEYFFQAFLKEVKEDEDDVIFSISSYHTLNPHPKHPKKMQWSNTEILQLMEKEYVGVDAIPTAHRNALAVDLPF